MTHLHPFEGAAPQEARNLIVVVRADPIICGHSTEARNLAEAALARGYKHVAIVTWQEELLQESGLPLKPSDEIQPYSPGIEVMRPAPIGSYKILDGRYLHGMTGKLIDLCRWDGHDGYGSVFSAAWQSNYRRGTNRKANPARPESDDGGRLLALTSLMW